SQLRAALPRQSWLRAPLQRVSRERGRPLCPVPPLLRLRFPPLWVLPALLRPGGVRVPGVARVPRLRLRLPLRLRGLRLRLPVPLRRLGGIRLCPLLRQLRVRLPV